MGLFTPKPIIRYSVDPKWPRETNGMGVSGDQTDQINETDAWIRRTTH